MELCVFAVGMSHTAAFESFSLPKAWEAAYHVGDISDHCFCPLRVEKPPISNQCHGNAIYQDVNGRVKHCSSQSQD